MPMNYKGRPRSPAYLEIWEQARFKVIELELDTRQEFQRLRAQLYGLRKTLEADNDPKYNEYKNLSITSEIRNNKFYLKIGPTDLELRNKLAKQGFRGDTLVEISEEGRQLIRKYGDDFLDPTK